MCLYTGNPISKIPVFIDLWPHRIYLVDPVNCQNVKFRKKICLELKFPHRNTWLFKCLHLKQQFLTRRLTQRN